MAFLIKVTDSLEALSSLLSLLLKEGVLYSDRIEILNILVSISPLDNMELANKFIPIYKNIVGTDFWNRAEQLYHSEAPLKWKVSYRGRLTGYNSTEEANQLKSIINTLTKRPNANTLSFSFYRPNDHIRAIAIPASMPCPIAGDLKLRNGKLHLNILFRSIDVFRLAFPDIFFLRSLQDEVLKEMQNSLQKRCRTAELGELNLFLSRAFILKCHQEKANNFIKAILKVKENLEGYNDR